MRKLSWALARALGMTTLLALMAAPAVAQSKPPVKLGLIMPYTGFASFLVPYFDTGFQLGLENVNATGGVNGSQLEFQREDDQLNAAQAVRGYRKLVRDGAFATFGPISSTAWENVVPLTERGKMPIVNTSAQKPNISNSQFTLRMTSNDLNMMPEGVAQFVKLRPDVKKIVILGDIKEVATASAVSTFEREAAKHGVEVLDKMQFSTQTTEFSPIVIKLRGLDPDAIWVSSLIPAVIALAKEMAAQNLDLPILGNLIFWPAGGVNVLAGLGREIYSMGFSTNEPTANEAHNGYIKRFQERLADNAKVPKPANAGNSTVAYEAVQLVAQIMRDAGIDGSTPVDQARSKIAAGLRDIKEWDGSLLQFKFDDKRDAYIRTHLLKIDNARKMWINVDPDRTR